MLRSCLFLIMTGGLTLALAGLLFYRSVPSGAAVVSIPHKTAKQQLVNQLNLTDLSLCMEARYTRHPSQADLFSAFQDFPGSFEHFPSGSMILPQPAGFTNRLQVIHQGGN